MHSAHAAAIVVNILLQTFAKLSGLVNASLPFPHVYPKNITRLAMFGSSFADY
jgi:hypothetical protein